MTSLTLQLTSRLDKNDSPAGLPPPLTSRRVSAHEAGSWPKNPRPMLASIAALLLLALLSGAGVAAEPKRILIIHSFGRDFAPYSGVGLGFRTELTQLRQPIAIHEESLDTERGGAPEDEQPFLEYLLRRNRVAPPDLVVAIAPPAMLFCLRHRDQLFPGRPLLITGIDSRRMDGIGLGARDRAVTVNLDFLGAARTMLQLQPDTTTLAIVLGTSQLEQFWAKEIQRELAPLKDRLRVVPPDGLGLDQMRQRVAALPPHSAVFYYMFVVGAGGALHEDERALVAIRESSNAPVFGRFADQLGRGIVGGSLYDTRQVGKVTAELAVRMLQGEDIPGGNVAVMAQTPTYDWRELERWGIPESRLPAGAELRFRPPSIWEQHKTTVWRIIHSCFITRRSCATVELYDGTINIYA